MVIVGAYSPEVALVFYFRGYEVGLRCHGGVEDMAAQTQDWQSSLEQPGLGVLGQPSAPMNIVTMLDSQLELRSAQ